jgi:hypothetical protein
MSVDYQREKLGSLESKLNNLEPTNLFETELRYVLFDLIDVLHALCNEIKE